ncbi:MARCKS-like protein [Paraburkholderia caledonica]|uniref:MARCKS-like protein n=1 Tax=Paraburkholderia caledonica TaxID=134536 RepID=UPI001FCA09F2|nr:MARCKS-like protein [Paraburkholderia caledonica]
MPGHTENIPSDGSDERRDGESGTQRLEDVAPGADPDTKPGTPPGTQSDADRTRSPD